MLAALLELPDELVDVEPLEWHAEHAVMVEFTFLCAETLLGAVPIAHAPQLLEVGRTVMLPVEVVVVLVLVLVLVFVVVGVVVAGVVVVGVAAVWQVVQTVL
jgi:hypothetical protein